ncbi:MAG: pyridoxal phosphate-dependent aminotransferase [Candidatus Hydrogenedentota bacterium]
MKLSKRTDVLKPSATLAITAKAKELKARGVDVVGFGAGEPDFDTPEFIKEAANKALKEGKTKYTPSSGIPELKQAICKKLLKDNGLEYKPEQVVVSCGAKHSLFNVILVLFDYGDEVIIPLPYWVTYPAQVEISGATPVYLRTSAENDFQIEEKELRKLITPKTRGIILNSPCNPTGAVLNKTSLEIVAKVACENDIVVISDEVYEKLIYDNEKHYSIGTFSEEIKRLTITVNGLSKSHSMTGWRMGYAAGPLEIMKKVIELQDQSTSNPNSITQYASLAAFSAPEDEVIKMREAFDKRRKRIVEMLNSIDGISCNMPKGAFYVFPDVSRLYGKRYKDKVIKNSYDIAEVFLTDALSAVVPGEPFGDDNFIRLSYALSMEQIEKGVSRIAETVGKFV